MRKSVNRGVFVKTKKSECLLKKQQMKVRLLEKQQMKVRLLIQRKNKAKSQINKRKKNEKNEGRILVIRRGTRRECTTTGSILKKTQTHAQNSNRIESNPQQKHIKPTNPQPLSHAEIGAILGTQSIGSPSIRPPIHSRYYCLFSAR